jgi:hypothetical protein
LVPPLVGAPPPPPPNTGEKGEAILTPSPVHIAHHIRSREAHGSISRGASTRANENMMQEVLYAKIFYIEFMKKVIERYETNDLK